MIHAIRSVRTRSPILFSSPPLPSHIGRRASAGVRFVQATTSDQKQQPDNNMDKPNNQAPKSGDVMSNSFGEGYATRSDEEGFGGIYSDNQSLSKSEDKAANHPGYDKSQGSEVKEKENARHQTNASA